MKLLDQIPFCAPSLKLEVQTQSELGSTFFPFHEISDCVFVDYVLRREQQILFEMRKKKLQAETGGHTLVPMGGCRTKEASREANWKIHPRTFALIIKHLCDYEDFIAREMCRSDLLKHFHCKKEQRDVFLANF